MDKQVGAGLEFWQAVWSHPGGGVSSRDLGEHPGTSGNAHA